jgi:ankyrin repeat protein
MADADADALLLVRKLHAAAVACDAAALAPLAAALRARGLDVNAADGDGRTAVFLAAEAGRQPGAADALRCLRDCGADFARADADGVTPLFIAAFAGAGPPVWRGAASDPVALEPRTTDTGSSAAKPV